MKHNIIPKALRCLAAAGLCLAAAACSKDDITPEPAPQQGITPTKIIFNVTRGGYEGDAETRAPKSGWAEGDVVRFYKKESTTVYKATYTGGEWVFDRQFYFGSKATLGAFYGEHVEVSTPDYIFMVTDNGDFVYTSEGSYEVDESGVATITLRLDRHPQGRMTFTGVGKGKELTVLNMKSLKSYGSSFQFEFRNPAPVTLTGEEDGTATLYALPDPTTVTEAGITLTVEYEGKLYTKTFAGKEFKENSNITLAAPSLEGGWKEAVTEYGAEDLKMGDYLYSDGTTSDGGLRKLFPDGTVETAPEAVAPEAGKTVIGIVFYAGRHATDASDYTKPLNAGGPTLADNVRGYAVAITDACLYDAWNGGVLWATKPNDEFDYAFEIDVSDNLDDWNGYANCQAIHNFVEDHAGEGFEMRHFQAAWVCETYGYRNLNYDGSVNGGDYTWQQLLKAPAGTSGWFLPSVGQLAYMRTNVNYLDERLEAVKGYSSGWPDYQDRIVPLSYKYIPYWSSTAVSGENNTALNRFITPDKPNVAIEDNRNDPYLPRPILVF